MDFKLTYVNHYLGYFCDCATWYRVLLGIMTNLIVGNKNSSKVNDLLFKKNKSNMRVI